MLECLVIGDSIAQGVGQQLPRCRVIAQSGITSSAFVNSHGALPKSRRVLISLGSNDNSNFSLIYGSLRTLRARFDNQTQVCWLLSSNNQRALGAASQVAREHGDCTITMGSHVSADRIHPTAKGYQTLAQQWQTKHR